MSSGCNMPKSAPKESVPICPTGTTYVLGGKHWVIEGEVKGVCMHKKRVSNKSYNEFLVQNNKTLSSYRRATKPLAPVVNVSYNDARKYCQSRGMRLPTFREWMWAVRVNNRNVSWPTYFRSLRIHRSLIMKGESGKRLYELVKNVKYPRRITGYYYDKYAVRTIAEEYPATRKDGATTFRCAVDPKTRWAKQINRLVRLIEGLPLFFVRAILGWEDPR